MSVDRDKVVEQAKALASEAKDFADKAKQLADDAKKANVPIGEIEESFKQLADQRKEVNSAMSALSALLDPTSGDGVSSTFSEFLNEVGGAAVAAQSKLDEHNRAALAQGLANGGVPVGVFQLPRLKGEIRFGFQEISKEKLGLVFYSRGTQQESRNEQSLQFEILAVPPPPEMVQSIRSLRPEIPIVLNPTERSAAFTAIDQVQELLGKDETPLSSVLLQRHKEALTKEPEAVILIPVLLDPTKGREFMVFYAGPKDSAEWYVGVWQLALSPPKLHILWQLDAPGTSKEDVARFKNWVRSVAEKQAELLRQISP